MGAYGMGAGADNAGFNAGGGDSDEPPEHRYQIQLQQLNEMGFYDASKNIRALLATNGNVNAAIEYLLSNP
ncbi:Ubiquitin domain-containing protein DSK2b [Dimargaris xerosporica]|nr:Ubiquitin domain-containing protein DSK2b [Dimargaris xerosporica]